MENNEKHSEKSWYAIYTRSRAEKKVKAELDAKKIECFLPIQKRLRQWSDRKKWVEMPLIPGYCFVHIGRKEYFDVLQTNHVIGYITFEGKAAPIPGHQIEALQKMLLQFDKEVSVSHDNFILGKKIEVIAGPLMGLKGELLETRGKNRFIIRIVQINTTFSVEIPANMLTYNFQ